MYVIRFIELLKYPTRPIARVEPPSKFQSSKSFSPKEAGEFCQKLASRHEFHGYNEEQGYWWGRDDDGLGFKQIYVAQDVSGPQVDADYEPSDERFTPAGYTG